MGPALNLAPVLKGSMPLKTTDERLAVALAQPRISEGTEEDLKKALRYIYTLVGIRAHNLPADEEKEFLHAYIFENYGTHTPQEIRLAFDMAVQGRLDVDARCFENFSVAYFASIMNAYRIWAAREVKAAQTKNTAPQYTRDQLVDINVEYAFFLFKQINKLPCKRGR